jgi:hypothetical protein
MLLAQKIAEGGSPLYAFTVRESLAGLQNSGKEKTAAEGQVCPNCGKVHALVTPNVANPVAAAPAPQSASQGQPCPVCGKIHPPAQTAGQTNTTAELAAHSGTVELIAGKYIYCDKCKIYHQTQPSPIVPRLPNLGAIKPPLTSTNSLPAAH